MCVCVCLQNWHKTNKQANKQITLSSKSLRQWKWLSLLFPSLLIALGVTIVLLWKVFSVTTVTPYASIFSVLFCVLYLVPFGKMRVSSLSLSFSFFSFLFQSEMFGRKKMCYFSFFPHLLVSLKSKQGLTYTCNVNLINYHHQSKKNLPWCHMACVISFNC